MATIAVDKRDEVAHLQDLRWAIFREDCDSVKIILDTYPALPRLLINTRGRCDQEVHIILFGLLLSLGRLGDLERLYGIVVSWNSDEDDPELPYQTISQKEKFGSRVGLIHEGIRVLRDKLLITVECPSVRGLVVDRLVGKGSFGHVFETRGSEGKDRYNLIKFSSISAEYVREFLSQSVLNIVDNGLPTEVHIPTSTTPEMIHAHLLELYPLYPITRGTIRIQTAEFAENHIFIDQIAEMLLRLFEGVKALRDRFIMHLDLSPNNIMWDNNTKTIRIIDYAGSIGDDTFLDIGNMTSRVCTRSSRAPEYGSSDTLWQRNESSEVFSAYYSLMSHFFEQSLIEQQPYTKDEICRKAINTEFQMAIASNLTPLPHTIEIERLRRVHEASLILPRERPPLEWLLSDCTSEGDIAALQMGRIGSMARYLHIRRCLFRFVRQWPKGLKNSLDTAEWRIRRTSFITLLLSRLNCATTDGINCGGLLVSGKIVPPPYTTTRCLSLYDALRDIVIIPDNEAEILLIRYMNDPIFYPSLVNAIIYIFLAPSKANLVDVDHYNAHPLHVVMRAILQFPYLSSLFLSPITVFSLLLLETPRANNDTTTNSSRHHRIIRCLYNLRREYRCQPMYGSQITHVANFTRNYIFSLLRAPIIFQGEETWWQWLLSSVSSSPLPLRENSQVASTPLMAREHVDHIINLWFSRE